MFDGSVYFRQLGNMMLSPSSWETWHSGSAVPGHMAGVPRAFTTVYVRDVSPTNGQDPRDYTDGYHVYEPAVSGYRRIGSSNYYLKYEVDPAANNPPWPA